MSSSRSTDDSTRYDTISRKVVNIYLAKGLQARKEVLVLRKIIKLDSQRFAIKDTIIVTLYEENKVLRESSKAYKKAYKRQKLWTYFFEVLSGALAAAYVFKK